MRILWRYILTRYLTSVFSVLLILILSILVVEILVDDEGILESGAGVFGIFLKICSSYLLQYLLPASALAGAFITLGISARAREITAMKAGGVSPVIAVIPILAAGALLAAVALLLGNTLVVMASQAWNRQTPGNAGEIAMRRGTFWYHSGRYIYNFADQEPDGTALHEVTVFELDERHRLQRRIGAAIAYFEEPDRWRFRDATIHRFDPERPSAPPGIERASEVTLELSQEPSISLMEWEVKALSIGDLWSHAAQRASQGRNVTRVHAVLHERLTEPVTVFLFALLAIPIGLQVEQTRSMARGALQAVALMFVYYSVRQVVSTLALEGVVWAAAPWGVLLLFATFGGIRLARVPR